jgi:hypothetical protein
LHSCDKNREGKYKCTSIMTKTEIRAKTNILS